MMASLHPAELKVQYEFSQEPILIVRLNDFKIKEMEIREECVPDFTKIVPVRMCIAVESRVRELNSVC